ncbi:MAG: right-handed parallel beta-helix repeat-containing protein, partial [Cyclobacteriaceae bacterium]
MKPLHTSQIGIPAGKALREWGSRIIIFILLVLILPATALAQQTYTVTNTTNSSTGSLRWAINQANNYSGSGKPRIHFDISGTGPHVILLAAGNNELPRLQRPMIIDGRTQSGYSAGQPMVAIDGSNLDRSFNNPGSVGFTMEVGGSEIYGLEIRSFRDAGIVVGNGSSLISGYTVAENVVHSTVGGFFFAPNGITVAGAANGVVRDNKIGILPDGTAAGNLENGLEIRLSANATVTGNIIGANAKEGIRVFEDNQGILIQNNLIGLTDTDPLTSQPNGNYGVYIGDNSSLVQVLGNDIGFGAGGIYQEATGSGNTFSGNDLYCIPAANAQQLASGANGGITAPVISSASCTQASGTAVSGAQIDIYEQITCASDNSRVDYIHLGTTIASGTSWTYTPSGISFGGKVLVATATNSQGSSSGFSNTRSVSISNPPIPYFYRVDGSSATRADENTVVEYYISSPQAGATYTWSVTNGTGGSIQGSNVGTNVNIAWGTWVSGYTTVTVSATNACGGAPRIYSRNIYMRPPTSTITGPDAVTAGPVDPLPTYSVAPRQGSYFYWYLPSGASIVSGTGTNSITVQFGNSGGDVRVSELNGVYGERQTKSVTVTPVTPAINAGIYAEVNPGQIGYYNVAFSSGSTYQWSVTDAQGQPVSGIDLSNQTRRSISVVWPATLSPQFLTLRCLETNNQGTTAANTSTLTVSIKPPAPSLIGAVQAGEGSDEVYTVENPVTGYDYIWTFNPPSAATWLTADNLPQRTVRWGAVDASVVVQARTPEGILSDPASLAVDVVPGPTTSPITGPSTVNGKETYTYYVTGTAGNTFSWSLPLGAEIVSENSIASQVDIRFGNVSGTVSVVETNELGVSGATQSLAVSVTPQPSPVLGTVNPLLGEEVIFSVDFTEGSTYQWTVGQAGNSAPAALAKKDKLAANIAGGGNIFSFVFNTLGANSISLVETTGDGVVLPAQILNLNVVSNFVIEGPVRVAPDATGITYSVPSSFSGVEWIVSSGSFTAVSGNTGTSFTVDVGSRGGLIQAIRKEGGSITEAASVYVEVGNPSDYQARVKIINSQNLNPFDLADNRFLAGAFNQGHEAEIVPESVLDSQSFLEDTDVIIISNPQIELTATRIENLRIAYSEYGMSIALVGEHDKKYHTNEGYIDLIKAIDPANRFNWRPGEEGIRPVTVEGTLANTRQQIETDIDFWYTLYGAGNGSRWEYLLKDSNARVGSLYKEDGPCGGKILHVTDSDFLKDAGEATDLVLNIIDEMAAGNRTAVDPALLVNSPKGTSQEFTEADSDEVYEAYETLGFNAYSHFFDDLSGWTRNGAWQLESSKAVTKDYENSQTSELISPAILLDTSLVDENSAVRGFMIKFDYRLESESTWDIAQVYIQVETDGSFGDWQLVSQMSGKSKATTYDLKYIPLRDPELWNKRIRVKFTFDTDECIKHFDGWELATFFIQTIYTGWEVQLALVPTPVQAPPTIYAPPYIPGTRTLLPNGSLEVIPNTPWLFQNRFELEQEGLLLENNCQVNTMVLFDANAGGLNGALRGYDDVNAFQLNLDRLKTLLENTGQGECKQMSYIVPGGRQDFTYTYYTDIAGSGLFEDQTIADLENILAKVTSLKSPRPGAYTFRSPLGAIYDMVTNNWDQFNDAGDPDIKYNIYFFNPEGDLGVRGLNSDRIELLNGELITIQQFRSALEARNINLIFEGSKVAQNVLRLIDLENLADNIFVQEPNQITGNIPKNKGGFNLVDIAKDRCQEDDEPCCEGDLASEEDQEDCCDNEDANVASQQEDFENLRFGLGPFDSDPANISSTE